LSCDTVFLPQNGYDQKYCSYDCSDKFLFQSNHEPWNKGLEYGKSNWLRKENPKEYRNLHSRIERKFGKPNFCEICKRTDNDTIYDWANISNEYKENRGDWQRLCRKCHNQSDYAKNEYLKEKITNL